MDAIKSSEYTDYEIIVVDDASIDKSPKIARHAGTRLIQIDEQSGPGAARNTGVQCAYRYYLPFYYLIIESKEIPEGFNLMLRNFQSFCYCLTHPYPSQEGNLKSPLLGWDSGVGINLGIEKSSKA